MNIALWIITGLLTALYLFSGFGKLFVPREKMAQMANAARWVLDFEPGTLTHDAALLAEDRIVELLTRLSRSLPKRSRRPRSPNAHESVWPLAPRCEEPVNMPYKPEKIISL